MHCCESWANADPFVQVPIHASGIGRTSALVSEICWTSTLRIWNHTTMLPIYQLAVTDALLLKWCKCRSISASAYPCIRNWSDIRACIRNLLDVHATYLESYYYVTN